jgi:hypothetical protein
MICVICDICKREFDGKYFKVPKIDEEHMEMFQNLSSLEHVCIDCMIKVDKFIGKLIEEIDNAGT